jgi:predicted O-methyltransferase YrrM
MQKYNVNIPGWMHEKELKILSTLAGYVPDNGSILEIGCFLGSSTTALYRGKHSSVTMDVVDNFRIDNEPLLVNIEFEKLQLALGDRTMYDSAREIAKTTGWHDAFRFCIGEEMYDNINVHPTSSKDFEKVKHYDLTFIDASHTLIDVTHDIEKYNSGTGLLLGDDFHSFFNGVVVALNQTRKHRTLIVFEGTKLWAIVPKKGYWRDVFKNNNLLFLD